MYSCNAGGCWRFTDSFRSGKNVGYTSFLKISLLYPWLPFSPSFLVFLFFFIFSFFFFGTSDALTTRTLLFPVTALDFSTIVCSPVIQEYTKVHLPVFTKIDVEYIEREKRRKRTWNETRRERIQMCCTLSIPTNHLLRTILN